MSFSEFQILPDEIIDIVVNRYVNSNYKKNNYTDIVNSACKLKTISEVNKKMYTLCYKKLQTLKELKNGMDSRRNELKEKYRNSEVLQLTMMSSEYDPLFEKDLKDIAIVMAKDMDIFFKVPEVNSYCPIIGLACLSEAIPIATIEYLLQQGANYSAPSKCIDMTQKTPARNFACSYDIIHEETPFSEDRQKAIISLFNKYFCRRILSQHEVAHIHRTVTKAMTAPSI